MSFHVFFIPVIPFLSTSSNKLLKAYYAWPYGVKSLLIMLIYCPSTALFRQILLVLPGLMTFFHSFLRKLRNYLPIIFLGKSKKGFGPDGAFGCNGENYFGNGLRIGRIHNQYDVITSHGQKEILHLGIH